MAQQAEVVGFRSECWDSDDDENAPLTQLRAQTKEPEDLPVQGSPKADDVLDQSAPPWVQRRHVVALVMTLIALGVFAGMGLILLPRQGSASMGSTATTLPPRPEEKGQGPNTTRLAPTRQNLESTKTLPATAQKDLESTTTLQPAQPRRRSHDPNCTRDYEDQNFWFNKKLGWCVDMRCKNPHQRYSTYLKVCQERVTVGRIDKLFGMMEDHGLDHSRVVDGIWPLGTPFLDREGILWHMALAEERLDPRKISGWGRNAPKFPRSWLPRLEALNHTKRYRYNFQGGGMDLKEVYAKSYLHRRQFMTKFAEAHFDGRDFLRWTDVDLNDFMDHMGNRYKPKGVYDYSGAKLPGGFILRQVAKPKEDIYFDDFYFGSMAASNFTIAPGGDGPCTLRFYEAVAARSIPLVPSEDAPGVGCHCPYSYIPYTFATERHLFEHSEAIAEANFRLFVKYQTFTQGDNVPKNAPATFV